MPRKGPHRYDAYARAHKDETLQRMNARNRYEAKNGQIPAGYDLDHKKPIVKGGSNAPSNLRVRKAGPNRGDKSWQKGRR
jgi:hypothetical protein